MDNVTNFGKPTSLDYIDSIQNIKEILLLNIKEILLYIILTEYLF